MRRKFLTSLVALIFSVIVNAQVKKVPNATVIVGKQWFLKFDGNERNLVGENYEKDIKSNLLILKSNRDYIFKLGGVTRVGTYRQEGNYLFLYRDVEGEMQFDDDTCVAFRVKILDQNNFEMTSIADFYGLVMTFSKY